MTLLVHALAATWPPFVLVAGLLLIGHVAASEGLFGVLGSWCARAPGGDVGVLIVTLVAVALVTAVLNLDTSVVFMTPVALQAAKAEGADEVAFLYGVIFMSNSASLLLLGSNLTNLLVFAGRGGSGSSFARQMIVPWVLSVSITLVVVLAWRWRALHEHARVPSGARVAFAAGPGVAGAAFAVVAMLLLAHPALWVLGVGVAAELYEVVASRRTSWREAMSVVNPVILSLLFVVAVAVGWFARSTDVTRSLVSHASVLVTIATSSAAAIVVNNLPAASLFAAHHIAHPFALLLGLDLGPNIVVTGALSSLLWIRIARRHGLRPSLITFSIVGTIIALVAMVSAAPLL